jgi:Domain of unknown function (DUF1844)
MSSAEDKSRGFVVSDRRVFTPGGEAREEGAPEAPIAPADEFSASETVQGGPAVPLTPVTGEMPTADRLPSPEAPTGELPTADRLPAADRLPPVDFSTFVLSLGSSALMHLGDIEDPTGGGATKNLPMAKHSIDILSMLQEKTKNNLNTNEAQLLENLLYDLRLRFVTVAKSKPK